MKKALAAAALLFALILSSCGRGVSISYMSVRNANDPQAILSSQGIAAYKETLTYYDPDGTVSYEYYVYTEKNQNGSKPYNIRESHADSDLYAYEGEIYSEKDKKIFSVLQAYGTYYEFTEKYVSGSIPLDEGLFYQLYSESSGDITTVAYYSDMLPETIAGYSPAGVKPGDTVKAVYELESGNVANKITYYIREGGDGSKERKLLCRQFEYYAEKQNVFGSLPEMNNVERFVKVKIEYSPDHVQTFTVPEGTFVGIDTAGRNIRFFSDPQRTVPFDFSTAQAYDGMVIYANQD